MESNACCFCGSENELSGRFFEDSNLAAHQFCLYFSSGLAQNGRDDEGFDGFLASDIKKELSRTRREKCTHCGKNNASIGCSLKRCRKVYHYQCGYANNAQFVFRGRFNSYCADHRERQDTSSLLNCSSMVQCPVCLDEITATTGDTEDILKMPCCRNKFAHKTCMQKTAYASGYFFKCPYCLDKFKFEKEMIRFGIFIPQRDAAWEEEEGAYAELLETYTRCDNPVCKCPQGREHSQQEGLWRFIRCHHCGQSAVHNQCLGRHRVPTYEYVCINCTPTNQQQQTSSSSKSSISNKSSPAKSSISNKNSPAKSSNSKKTSPTKPRQRSSPSKMLKPCQSSSSNRQPSCVPTLITALQRHENTKKEKTLHINYLQPKNPVDWRKKYDIRECRVVVKSLTEEFIRKHLHSTGNVTSSPLSTSPKKIISITNQERCPTTRTSYIMDQKPCVTKYEMSPINQECSADDFTHVADDSKDSIFHAPSPKTHDLSSPICIDVDGLTDKISFKFNPSPISSPSSSRSSQLADVFSKAKCSTPGVTVTQHVNSTPIAVSILTTINLTPTPQHDAHAKGTRKRLNPHTRKQTKLTKFFKKETDS